MQQAPHSAGDRRPRIIIVEDNPGDSLLLITELKAHSRGGKIDVLEDGDAALNFFRSVPISPMAVVMDIRLPKYDGMEVLRRIREESLMPGVPIVVLTGSTTPQEESAATALGVGLYRAKPMTLDALRALVREIIDILPQGGAEAATVRQQQP